MTRCCGDSAWTLAARPALDLDPPSSPLQRSLVSWIGKQGSLLFLEGLLGEWTAGLHGKFLAPSRGGEEPGASQPDRPCC